MHNFGLLKYRKSILSLIKQINEMKQSYKMTAAKKYKHNDRHIAPG